MRSALKWTGVGVLAVLLLGGAVVLGPPLFRSDQARYRWAGAIGEGLLKAPIGAAYHNGRLYVTDAGAGRVVVFDTTGAVRAAWGGAALDLGRPMHLTRGRDGLFYVTEYANDRVSVVDST
jgi:DNA-binding beta-propeller fold protein YncE